MATADGAVGRIGCFGLIEPLVGSGVSGAMLNTAKRDGDIWTLKGEKRWIGNASLCDVSVIWARALADDHVKGFIVENKTTPGFSVEKLEHKIRLKIARVLLGGKGIVAGYKVARCLRSALLIRRHLSDADPDSRQGRHGTQRLHLMRRGGSTASSMTHRFLLRAFSHWLKGRLQAAL